MKKTLINVLIIFLLAVVLVVIFASVLWWKKETSIEPRLEQKYVEKGDLYNSLWPYANLSYYDKKSDEWLRILQETGLGRLENSKKIEALIATSYPNVLAIQFKGEAEAFYQEFCKTDAGVAYTSKRSAWFGDNSYIIKDNILWFNIYSAFEFFYDGISLNEDKEAYYSNDGSVLVKYVGSGSTYNVKEGTSVIGSNAFEETSIQSVHIPETVIEIRAGAFWRCLNLTEINFPSSLARIGSFALGSTSIKEVTIPSGITNIGQDVFMSSQIETIYIPAQVTHIEGSAFRYANKLENIIVAEDNKFYRTIDGSLYSKDGKELVRWVGKGNDNFTVPNSAVSIGPYAFDVGKAAKVLTIPRSVREIAQYSSMHKFAYVYYDGTRDEWKEKVKDYGRGGCVYFYFENKPRLNEEGTEYNGHYWRYVSGERAIWTVFESELGSYYKDNLKLFKEIWSDVFENTYIKYYVFDSWIWWSNEQLRQQLEEIGINIMELIEQYKGNINALNKESPIKGIIMAGEELLGLEFTCQKDEVESTLSNGTFVNDNIWLSKKYSADYIFVGDVKLEQETHSSTDGKVIIRYIGRDNSYTVKEDTIRINELTFYKCWLLEKIYYEGTQIDGLNIGLTELAPTRTARTIYYYSEAEPALDEAGTAYDGNYWRYVNNIETIWIKE